MISEIESKKNKLNFELRSLLSIIDMIDGEKKEHFDYKENTMTEEQFLDKHIVMIEEAKNRLLNVFKG